MGTQNLLNNYGSKVDAKLSYSGYYDFYLAADERDFQREVVYSDNIIGYKEPRTPQVGNMSNTLPLWIDLNNTASTTQPLLTAVTFNQQTGWWDSISTNPATFNYGLTSTGFPQTVISQNYWGQALSYCDCPYENDEDQYNVNNYPLNAVDIGQYETMLVNDSTQISLWGPSVPISGLCSSSANYSALTCNLNGQTGATTLVPAYGIFSFTAQDRRFKLWQVSANTQAPSQSGATTRNVSNTFFQFPDSGDATNPGPEDSSQFNMSGSRRYTISSSTDSSGYYQELLGGYYTGAYKFYGYPYAVLPDRPDEGWTMETFLKIRATGSTEGACFSTNYNPEKNIRVNPGDGCYEGPFPLTDGYTRNGKPVETVYYTNPVWNTGVTVTETGVTLPDSVDCTEFNEVFGCRTLDGGRVECENSRVKDFCLKDCQGSKMKEESACLCCLAAGFKVPQQQPKGEVYNFSYVVDSEGDCVDTACYGMKYTGYDYDTDTWLTARTENLNCTADTRTVNDDFPNNSGFFYYIGTRAENKFHNEFPSETGCTSMSGLNCCMDTISGHTLGPAVINVSPFDVATGGTSTTVTMTSTTQDVYSNNLGFRITPDFRIGYRTIRYTGGCETTAATASGSGCTSGDSFVFGYDIEEKYSDVICPSIINSGNCEDTWIHVGVSFERYFPIISGASCAQIVGNGVEYALGGLLDPLYLFSGITSSMSVGRCDNAFDELPLIPEDGYYEFDASGITGKTDNTCCFTAGTTFGSWLSHDEYRRGDLVFYVNGRRHFKVENFEEIIPRALNQHRDLQVGVPFNIAWGGASIGLLENMTLSTGSTACTLTTTGQTLQQDPDDLNLLIEQNFAGTWMGGISQLRYYTKPLMADEMYHNFLVNKDRYKLTDCEFAKNCSKNNCDSSQVLYLRDGNMYDIKGIFGYLSNNLYFTSSGQQVKFRSYTQENVTSVKFYKKFKQEPAVEVTMPVWMNPEDTLEVVIIKMDESLDAIITLLGNTYK